MSLHDLSAPPAYFEALHARLHDLYACHCDECQSIAQLSAHTLNLSLEKRFKSHLNKGKTALKTLFDNQGYQPKDLQTEKAYQDLVQSTSDIFELAIQDNDMPNDMRRALASDAFLFGSLKANAQLFEGSKLLTKEDGTLKSFQELTQDFDKLNIRYNQTYLESEYEFAVGSAQMASKWSEFGSSERYYLQYRTAKDERVRASHAVLADITLPKEDPFWDRFLPPNGWRCRCQTVEVLKSNYEPSNAEDAIKKGETATTEIGKNGKNRLEMFRFNPGKNKVLFPPKHPYNKVVGAKEVKTTVLTIINNNSEQLKALRKEKDAEIKEWAKANIPEKGLFTKSKNFVTGEVHITRSAIKSIGDHLTSPELKEVAKHIVSNIKNFKHIASAPLDQNAHNYSKKLAAGVTQFHYYEFEWNKQKFRLNTEEIYGKVDKPYSVNLIIKE